MADDGTGDPQGQAPEGTQTPANVDPTTDPQNPTPQTQTTEPEGQAPSDDVFDRDRAMATIRKLREEAKSATRALKELDTLRAERKAAEDAKLSDQDRLTKRTAELEAELSLERTTAQERINRYEVQLLASRLGIIDPDAAVKLLDWSSLDYGEDGKPKDVEAALKALAEDKPYLIRQAEDKTRQPQGSPTNPATRNAPAGSRRYTSAEIADRAFWNANKDDIMRAFREGRIEN